MGGGVEKEIEIKKLQKVQRLFGGSIFKTILIWTQICCYLSFAS